MTLLADAGGGCAPGSVTGPTNIARAIDELKAGQADD